MTLRTNYSLLCVAIALAFAARPVRAFLRLVMV